MPCRFIHSTQYAILCSSFPVSVGVSVSSPQRLQRKFFVVPAKVSVFLFYFPFFLRMKYNPSFFVFPFCSISLAHAGEIFCNFSAVFRLHYVRNIFLRFPCPYQARPAAPDVCISLTDLEIRQHTPIDLRNFYWECEDCSAWRFRWMLQ